MGFQGNKTSGKPFSKPYTSPAKNKATAKKYDLPAMFLNREEGQYGPMYVGEYNGKPVIASETKVKGQYKITVGDEFSCGKERSFGEGAQSWTSIPFVIEGQWWYATFRTNTKGEYMLIKSTGREAEPSTYSVASDSVFDRHTEINAQGHQDEGDAEIPEEAYAPKAATKPAPVRAPAHVAKKPVAVPQRNARPF